MKSRRFLAVATATVIAAGSVTPVAQAQHYPEPLNQVMNEMRRLGGPQAPNLLLVPAVLSSLNIAAPVLVFVSAFAVGGLQALSSGSSK